MCSIDISHNSVNSNDNPIDVFTVGNLTGAGIQPGSTCSVEGCYEYTVLSDGAYIYLRILTPRAICSIQRKIVWHLKIMK